MNKGGFLKIAQELFLGDTELKRQEQFLDINGYKQAIMLNAVQYGLNKNVATEFITEWKNGKTEQGSTSVSGFNSLKINELTAIDKNGNFLYLPLTDNIDLTNVYIYEGGYSYGSIANNTGDVYWLKVTHNYSTIEDGTVDIDAAGNLTGHNTHFLDTLRGQPNFPTKITLFSNGSTSFEFEVLSVISDTSAKLQGMTSFTPGTGLKYQVVGTFTNGYNPPSGDKYPFQYDSCLLTFVHESSPYSMPVQQYKPGLDFYLCRISLTTTNVLTITDARADFVLKMKDFYQYDKPLPLNIPGTSAIYAPIWIGIESIKYDDIYTPRDKNIVQLSWSFTASTFSINGNTINITAGNGGLYKSIQNLFTGCFNTCRIYSDNSDSYALIVSSTTVGTPVNTIQLQCDSFDPELFSNSTNLIITPDCEGIELKFIAIDDTGVVVTDLPNQNFQSKINVQNFRCPLIVYNYDLSSGTDLSWYNVQYRLLHNDRYSAWQDFTSDNTNGYYDVDQFDDNGKIVSSPLRTQYTVSPLVYDSTSAAPETGNGSGGWLLILYNQYCYKYLFDNTQKDGLFGVEISDILTLSPVPSNSNPLNLIVGKSKIQQIFSGNITLTQDFVINIKSNGAKEGSSFTLIFGDKNGTSFYSNNYIYNVLIYSDFGTPGQNLLKTMKIDELTWIRLPNKNLIYKFTFDGTYWNISVIEDCPAYKSIMWVYQDAPGYPDFGVVGPYTGCGYLTGKYAGYAIMGVYTNPADHIDSITSNAILPEYIKGSQAILVVQRIDYH